MAEAWWETIRVDMCERAGQPAALEVQRVYAAELLPDQPPHVAARRCSLGIACNMLDRPGCCFAGTLPGYDPRQP